MATYRRREEVEAVEAQRPGMLTTPDGPAAYLPGGFHNYDAPRGKLRDEAAGISLEVRPRHAAGGQVSANFDAAMQADAAAILGADGEFAEAVTYKPRRGATRAIYASVIRNPPATPAELNGRQDAFAAHHRAEQRHHRHLFGGARHRRGLHRAEAPARRDGPAVPTSCSRSPTRRTRPPDLPNREVTNHGKHLLARHRYHLSRKSTPSRPATVTTGDVNTLTYTAEDGTVTPSPSPSAARTTAAAASAGLIAAWNANTTTAAIATASGTSTVILTAVTAGVPFAVASSVTGTARSPARPPRRTRARAIGARRQLVGGSVPVSQRQRHPRRARLRGRRVRAEPVRRDADQPEHRQGLYLRRRQHTAPLRISATNWRIGQPAGDGSSPAGTALINLNFGTVQYTGRMIDSNSTGTSGLPTVNVKGSHASNKIYMSGGTLGIGTALPGDTATVSSVSVTGGKLTSAPA
jgi:hypothetical protein